MFSCTTYEGENVAIAARYVIAVEEVVGHAELCALVMVSGKTYTIQMSPHDAATRISDHVTGQYHN